MCCAEGRGEGTLLNPKSKFLILAEDHRGNVCNVALSGSLPHSNYYSEDGKSTLGEFEGGCRPMRSAFPKGQRARWGHKGEMTKGGWLRVSPSERERERECVCVVRWNGPA